MPRSSCLHPGDCTAGKRGPCARCQPVLNPGAAAANAERARERMRKRHADPDFAAANAERMRKRHADPDFAAAHAERARERMRKRHAERRGFEVPAWVERSGLRADFIDVALESGEEAAAAHCRALLRAERVAAGHVGPLASRPPFPSAEAS